MPDPRAPFAGHAHQTARPGAVHQRVKTHGGNMRQLMTQAARAKRRLWSSIAIRIFALLYLLYILYKLAVLHGAGDSGVSDAVFYLVCAAIAAAELGIGYSVFRSAAKLRRPKD